MALVTKDFSINITPGEMPPIIHVSEYDIGRAFNVTLIGENRNAFEIPTGTTATIEGTLNGTVGFTQSATVSNSQVSFTLSESMTAYSGKAWCKIKLMQNSQPIQTCAFILAVDRAGVEAETVIGADGFQEQINEGIAEYFDNDPPFFELPSGGQSGQALVSDGNGDAEWGGVPFQLPSGGDVGQALLSDGNGGAYWGEAGIPEAVKTALLNCFRNVAWVTDQGQALYDALYEALYSSEEPIPPIPQGIAYQIKNQTYDGTQSSIITDVKPLTSDQNYLIIADFTVGDSQGDNSYILSLLAEGSTHGVRIDLIGGLLRFWTTAPSPNNIFKTGSYIVAGRRYKVAYLHYAGANYVSFAYTYVSATNIGGISVIPGQVFTTNNPIYAVGSGFSGTVHELTFYNDFGNPMDKITPVLSPESKLALWEVGAMSGSTGGMLDSTTRARTLFFLDTAITSIVLSSGYEMLLYAWDAITGEYIGAWNGSEFGTSASYASSINFASIKSQYPQYNYRVLLRKSNNGTITAQEAYSNVTFS